MPTYHQMGHDSENLLSEKDLIGYKGALLSPVNYTEQEVAQQVKTYGSNKFEMILDPQLYFPNSVRGELPKWSYFPADVDTVDQSSITWWDNLLGKLSKCLLHIRPDAVCSPAVVPRTYSEDYYFLAREVARRLSERLSSDKIKVLQTLIVRMGDLSDKSKPAEIASIITGGVSDRVFVVFVSDTEPRRELNNTEDIKGAMRLIRYLSEGGIRVLVGFASSEIILWKVAGASDCASGKFFNLRRFTPSRWELPTEGGGQLPYWFEESMMAYLRESDMLRVRNANLLSSASKSNPYAQRILQQKDTVPEQAWLRLSWRQYLYWFNDFESRFDKGMFAPNDLLKNAEKVWSQLESQDILMEERQNDGSWLRDWRRAILEAFKEE